MNESQKTHLKYILDTSHGLIMDKYIRGALEHQSNLAEDYTAEQLLDEAINEAIDQITYLLTLKEKLNDNNK